MAVSYTYKLKKVIQSNASNPSATTDSAITTSGNSLLIFIAGDNGYNSGCTVSSITIGGNNATYRGRIDRAVQTIYRQSLEIWTYWAASNPNATATCTWSVNATSGSDYCFYVIEATGTDSASPADTTSSNSGNSDTASVQVTSGANNSVPFAAFTGWGSLFTAGTNTADVTNGNFNDGYNDYYDTCYSTQSTTSGNSYTIQATQTSGEWSAIGLDVKPAATGGATTNITNPGATAGGWVKATREAQSTASGRILATRTDAQSTAGGYVKATRTDATTTAGGQIATVTYGDTIGSRTYGAGGGNSAAATFTVSYPASIAAGDLLILACYTRSNNATAFSAPTDWSTVKAVQNTANGSYAVYYKIATGSESGTLTVNGSASNNTEVAKMVRIPGGSTTFTDGALETEAAGTSFVNSGVTPPRDNCLVVLVTGFQDHTTGSGDDGFSGWTGGTNLGTWDGSAYGTATGTDGTIGVGTAKQTTAAATGNLTVTHTSETNNAGISYSFAISPRQRKTDTATASGQIALGATTNHTDPGATAGGWVFVRHDDTTATASGRVKVEKLEAQVTNVSGWVEVEHEGDTTSTASGWVLWRHDDQATASGDVKVTGLTAQVNNVSGWVLATRTDAQSTAGGSITERRETQTTAAGWILEKREVQSTASGDVKATRTDAQSTAGGWVKTTRTDAQATAAGWLRAVREDQSTAGGWILERRESQSTASGWVFATRTDTSTASGWVQLPGVHTAQVDNVSGWVDRKNVHVRSFDADGWSSEAATIIKWTHTSESTASGDVKATREAQATAGGWVKTTREVQSTASGDVKATREDTSTASGWIQVQGTHTVETTASGDVRVNGLTTQTTAAGWILARREAQATAAGWLRAVREVQATSSGWTLARRTAEGTAAGWVRVAGRTDQSTASGWVSDGATTAHLNVRSFDTGGWSDAATVLIYPATKHTAEATAGGTIWATTNLRVRSFDTAGWSGTATLVIYPRPTASSTASGTVKGTREAQATGTGWVAPTRNVQSTASGRIAGTRTAEVTAGGTTALLKTDSATASGWVEVVQGRVALRFEAALLLGRAEALVNVDIAAPPSRYTATSTATGWVEPARNTVEVTATGTITGASRLTVETTATGTIRETFAGAYASGFIQERRTTPATAGGWITTQAAGASSTATGWVKSSREGQAIASGWIFAHTATSNATGTVWEMLPNPNQGAVKVPSPLAFHLPAILGGHHPDYRQPQGNRNPNQHVMPSPAGSSPNPVRTVVEGVRRVIQVVTRGRGKPT